MEKYIVTLDSGTTSVRTLIINKHGDVVSVAQQEISQIYPRSGWVEHDPLEIWNSQRQTMQSAKHKAKIKSVDVAAVGITNQRETILIWDKLTGLPVYNALVWQDTRTHDFCEALIKKGHQKMIQEKTGLLINPYFSGTKLKWILENVEGVGKKLAKKELLAGTIDTWLIWKLTNGKVHATDVSNASRTLLFNIHTMKWDDEILELLNIPKEILPEVKASNGDFGIVDPLHWSNNAHGKVPIRSAIGDQQSALFGQLSFNKGDVKNTYGTGAFMLLNTGEKAINSKNRLLTTVAWQLEKEKAIYALEGSVFVAGASLKWLRDSLRLIYASDESDYYANRVQDDGQRVYVVPAFTGLGAPYWDSSAKGAIFGLERSTNREHLVKATLESIAYQSNDLLKAMESDLKEKIKVMKVDGGVSNSKFLLQFQADISNLEVIKPKNIETTAMGAAYLAGLAVKFWTNLAEIEKISKIDTNSKSKITEDKRKFLLKGWNEAVKRTLNWSKDIEEVKNE
ncbi:glycerol kinase GlpK [[Mycoplasma] mobile]|uniref:Glycerol kinase n=1 Tax=Mycoplasma mobile (strain ATCC 43663 / 163K / NCTC 11711) TaxID=267748 RepID=Q6KHZ6_MYCM1|nr:glycerol kinase GlpK [[Mycoplasma] mobile]AAT27780.1 glycerol kinase [Mycoplasma mobile 163K]